MTKETFFIQVPPGLEDLALKEFHLKYINIELQVPEPTVEKGGLLVKLPLEKGVALNSWLKIPNRILLRIDHFKCRDLPKLFNRVSKLPLGHYFAGQDFSFHISSSASRLFDSRKIEATLKDALDRNFQRQEPKKKAKERVSQWDQWRFYCRFQDDWCELSIDTTGERLGKRGDKSKVGRAPLRENLASALYFAALQQNGLLNEMVQAEQRITLVDPFAGSGTLLSEAANFFKPSQSREFTFSYFPVFNVNKNSTQNCDPKFQTPLTLIAGEKSEQQYQALEENLKEFLPECAHLYLGDSFDGKLHHLINEISIKESSPIHLCLTNPPYGQRIKDSKKMIDLLNQIFHLYPFDRVGILMPKDAKLPQGNRVPYLHLKSYSFSHGGIPVVFSLWSKKETL
ncbi:MAG: hypothetical protein CME63_04875 [Halobacteriovoraceae bacterium]|nr:hypothetical protein [Halobacteriovoraceae bacterium]MBC97058.1 hypothetical protein [Halobacteriovoraceae bacterium]|tara:strand:- start:101005 stop:102201 length:1197 start_codon:yes stop_codon:yes gene_type:complete